MNQHVTLFYMLVLAIVWFQVADAWTSPKFTTDEGEEDNKMFRKAKAGSSQHLYDLFTKEFNDIFIVVFSLDIRNYQEEEIEKLQDVFSGDREIFDQIVYIKVDASDRYQYQGIMYDLDILMENHISFPYFLVIQNQVGNVIRGPDASDQMEEVITRFGNGEK